MNNKFDIDIAEAIALAEGIDSTELEFTLYDYIDVNAVDALLSHPKSSWTLSFAVPDHIVTVTSDRTIDVEPRGSSSGK